MRFFSFILIFSALVLFEAIPAVGQEFAPLEPRESMLFRDGERWIHERFRWFREQRLQLNGLPDGAREDAWNAARAMAVYRPHVTLAKSGAAAPSAWVNIGPVNAGGRITGVAIHPANPDIVWFTGADGGVWRSVNGGASYAPVADDLPTMAMGAIAVDPNNPAVIWVGTGEANGSGDCYPGVGVVVSRDNGATWTISGTKPAANIVRMLVDRSDSRVVFCASRTGLFRSTDNGATWKSVQSGFVSDIAQHPVNAAVLFAGVQGTGVMKSTDHGATWSTVNAGIAQDSIGRVVLSICRAQPACMYAVVVSSRGSGLQCVVKSTDGGGTWSHTNIEETPNFFGTQGWYNVAMAVDPVNPDCVLVGGVSMYRTTDGGESWNGVPGLHVDQHAIEFSPSNPLVVYAGNDGGIYKSTNGGASFTSQNANLPITQFYELGVSQQNPYKLIGGTQDNGTKRRTAATNLWMNATGGDGGYGVYDHSDTNYIYTEYQNGSHTRSSDAGRTYVSINKGLIGLSPWVTPVAMHPTNSSVLFTCTNRQLYKTTNRGTQWFAFHGNMDSSSTIKVIAISPVDPRIMLIGFMSGKIWKTTNDGASWQSVSTGLPAGTVTDIAFNPLDSRVFYCCYSGYSTATVFRTVDGGTQWRSIAGNLPAIPKNALAINPRDTANLFVGTDFGVYSTTNSGTSWQILGDGMPKAVVVDLELHSTGVLRAATHGRSIYELAVFTPVELAVFTAERAGRGVLLRWRTQSETNNAGFVVERRGGGASWTDIGYAPGQGTTTAPHDYAFTDADAPRDGTIFYRLRQVNLDGTSEYSPEARIDAPVAAAEGFVLDRNYPNPCAPVTTIGFSLPRDGAASILVTDAAGRPVGEYGAAYRLRGEYVTHIDTSALASGVYFYHLVVDGMVRETRSMGVVR